MRILLATLLLIAVIPAYGSMIVIAGVTELSSAPTSVMPPSLVSDSTIYGFSEQQGLVLSSAVTAGITSTGAWICCSGFSPGTIPIGTTVNSYLLYASPVTDEDGEFFRQFVGEITFSPGEKILGIIIGYQNIAATDGMLGAPGSTYPPASFRLGGLEQDDEVAVASNMQAVFVKFNVEVGGDDMIRILTISPEPADFVLLGSGLLALALFGRRLRFRRASR